MIVLDIETSGLYPEKHGIWQIGAVDFENPSSTFLKEGRIDDEDEFTEGAAKVHGKSESYLRDSNKQIQKELLEKFFGWCKGVKVNNAVCHNPQFDIGFISLKARKYGLDFPIVHRSFDTHSIAATKYLDLNGKLLIDVEKGKSGMSLANILKLCGMENNRGSHDALEDAKLTAECLSRIWYGKSIFSEYSQFEIPEALRK
jgi:DNA polymerase III subunit epsilon